MTATRLFALALLAAVLSAPLAPTIASAQPDLIMTGGTMTLGGTHTYDEVRPTAGARIEVTPFDGTDRVSTGNLVIIANSIFIDATSSITARGAGYTTPRCADGRGPAIAAGGAGGCSVRDSGGGGAHFGRGGRGTRDAPASFPAGYEEDCGNSLNAMSTACSVVTDCRNGDGLPTVAGSGFFHSIYEIEFGASGGDKGCRDGDGFGTAPAVGGPGGGRIVLVSLRGDATGAIDIQGTVTANGRRGCGSGNDSGGGGAGGTVFIVGDQVQVGPAAVVSAAGGLGGDTRAGAAASPDSADCPAGSQTTGTCDDCGGGGGGGIIVVQSRASDFAYGARFDVAGALGGVCDICRGEAGGGAGELQLDGAYVGEICDGYDNDFDGMTDESLGNVTCGLGTCATDLPSCTGGEPNTCAPGTSDPSCFDALDAARPRVAVILDTSASMLLDLSGYPTFGDGSVDHPGVDTDGDGAANDSRLLLARTALGDVISAYPEIEFALARYHQDVGLDRFCQSAAWFECAGIVGTYDDPRDNTGATVCNVATGPSTTLPVRAISTGDECINYAGSCGGPRRGADILSGFGSSERDIVRWLDGRETDFRPGVTAGNHCDHDGGGDCEVRGAGPTPLAGSLEAITDYIAPIRSTDAQVACRTYSVILVTDGAESCDGNPVAAATALRTLYGVETYVVAVSVLASEEASLNAISNAGSGGARPTATFVRAPEDLVPALTAIIEGSIRTERCNGTDDDCDLRIDEGFDTLGAACDDGGTGVCQGRGTIVCAPSELTTECDITMPGLPPLPAEICNSMDDDCDEAIDEGLTCTGMCTPTGAEVCNGIDDDCNGLIDEVDPALGTPCGEDEGECAPGMIRCVLGELLCVGGTGPRDEVCNGLDDDCDGMVDQLAECPAASACIEGACRRVCDPDDEFPCPPDFVCESVPGLPEEAYCLPTICATCAPNEICVEDTCIDPCMGITCDEGLSCVRGTCVDCNATGCPSGQVCRADVCVPDRCATRTCEAGEMCVDGTCERSCGAGDCPSGQRCAADGTCESDPCAGLDCGTGRYCDEGTCRPDPCDGMSCPRGDVCVPSMGCIDDPCVGVDCPAGRRCVASDRGTAACTGTGALDAGMPDAGGASYGLGAGGGLCSASPGGRAPWPWLLLLLGLSLVVRRSR